MHTSLTSIRAAMTALVFVAPPTQSLVAQSWTQLSPSGAVPLGRIYHTLTFDSARDRGVLFGGLNGLQATNDTWEWDPSAESWTQRTPANSPSAREVMAFTYDASRGKTVVWGGFNSGTFLSDTWEWDGTNWQQASSGGPFPGRCGAAMVYDHQRNKCILFGGQGQLTFANDLWEWNGASWTQVHPGGPVGTAPLPRFFHNMVYDAVRDRVVVFGGTNGSISFNDTWAWSPQSLTWTQINSPGPSPRSQCGMIYDASIDMVLLYGGEGPGASPLGDVWVLDGNTWTQSNAPTSPPARRRHVLAHRPNTRTSLMFGGQKSGGVIGETWSLDTGPGGSIASVSAVQLATTSTPVGMSGFAVAPLPSGDTLVYGGSTMAGRQPFTYTLIGTTFTLELPNVNPAFRSDTALALDRARGNNILFGGRNPAGVALGDTWIWATGQWSLITPSPSPSARSGHRMAYDEVANLVLLFGGQDSGGNALGDFWSWNGSTWTQLTPNLLPPPRSHHGMAYHPRRNRTVLHGGVSGSTQLDDIWEWDGAAWHNASAARAPSERHGASLVRDAARNRLVLFGGRNATTLVGDTWELIPAAGPLATQQEWSLTTPATSPTPRTSHGMTYDLARTRTVLFGGNQGTGALSDTWLFDGTTWSQPNLVLQPPSRWSHGMAYDTARSRTVLFGGWNGSSALNDTWEWNGTTWSQPAVVNGPAGRRACGMTYDSARQRIVVFGGLGSGSSLFGDTWEYDGLTWTQRATTGPSPRHLMGLCFDSARNETVLFGGGSSTAVNAETWTWNGTTWTQRAPAEAPSPRWNASLSFDPARSRVILFGGADATFSTSYRDTWEWDGTNWAATSLARSDGAWNPGARDGHAAAYDPRSELIVLHGGRRPGGCFADTWSWSGTEWTLHLPSTTSPSSRTGSQMYYDATANEFRIFAGSCGSTFYNDLWLLNLPVYSRGESYGQGCNGSLGVPTLSIDPPTKPVIGTTMNLRLSNIPGTILPTLGAYGYSRTSWNGIPLPLDLAPAGLPGCPLLTNTEVTATLASPGGTGTVLWPVPIPNSPVLLGGEIYFQSLHFELPGFPRWAALTNGIAIRIGEL
jgi:hypothetical protein